MNKPVFSLSVTENAANNGPKYKRVAVLEMMCTNDVHKPEHIISVVTCSESCENL